MDRQDDLESSVVDVKSVFSVFLEPAYKSLPHLLFLPKAILTLTNLRLLSVCRRIAHQLQGYNGQPILAADHNRISRHARLQRERQHRISIAANLSSSTLLLATRQSLAHLWSLLPPSLHTLPREHHTGPFLDTTPGQLSI